MTKLSRTVGLILAVLCGRDACAADTIENDAPAAGDSVETRFCRGAFEAAVTSGALFSPFVALGNRPTINYAITEVQIGYMLADVQRSGWLRGNFEAVGEGFGGGIFQGPGSYLAGMTVWGRYNFVQLDWRLVPYAQAGAGLTSTDVSRRFVGQPFNFNLELGLGARYFFTARWAAQFEFRYQHISNANTGAHNLGINAVGPVLGVSYLF